MALSSVTQSTTHMSWLGPQASPAPPKTGWVPPAVASNVSTATAPNAGDSLVQAAADAAKQAFLFSLKIAFSDDDRRAAAQRYLAATNGESTAALQSDPITGSLRALAQSIIARTQYKHGSAFLSTVA
jgi:hypothetical protein